MSLTTSTATPVAGAMPEAPVQRKPLWCKHCHAENTEPYVPTMCGTCKKPTHWLMSKPLSLFTHEDWIVAKVNRIIVEPEDLPQ